MKSKVTTEIAIRTKDIKVTYTLKKAMIRPIIMGLKQAIIDKGDITIVGLGRFFIKKTKVADAIGSKNRKYRVAVRFRPARMLAREVAEKWEQPLELSILPSEPVSSAPDAGDSQSSAPEDLVRGDSSSI